VQDFLARLVAFQARRPLFVLCLAALTILPGVLLARKLELKTGFSELLPDSSPSVVEHRRVSQRLAGLSTLSIAAEANDTELLKRFVDEMGPKLRALPKEWVSNVDDGPRAALAFFQDNKHLYAELAEVEKLHDQVVERYDWEVGKKLGTNLDDDDDPPPGFDAKELKQRLEPKAGTAKAASANTSGYYIGEDGKLAAIVVQTPLGAMDQRAFELRERISKLIDAGDYRRKDASFRYGFSGSLITSAEQYRAVKDDLTSVGAIGVCLVLLVVYLFFWRLRVLAALGVAVGFGCLWCFALTELTIGYLNTATSFLISIVAGNGINAMIVYMARYIEARRDQGESVPEALRTATVDTYQATLAAVAVAMAAYGALMLTEFRGFRHFGAIGAAGMLLCWVSTYLILPCLLVVSERLRPFPAARDWRDRLAGAYARPFIWLAQRYPWPISVLGVLAFIGALACTVLYFGGQPMEYDLRKIRNDELAATSAGRLGLRINQVAGRLSQSGRAVLTDRVDQVQPLVRELERRRDTAPESAKPFGEVASIFTLLPKDQARKLELWKEIVDRVERARKRGFLSAEQWQELEPLLPKKLATIGIADLPAQLARPFEEKDGTRGRIVYVAPARGKSLYDANYLMLWANSFRETKLPNGEVIHGTGEAVVFADMLLHIEEDAPVVAFASFCGTMIVILLAFRGRSGGFVALATLSLGVASLIAVLYLSGVKLNFLNFIALPIAIGVGSDYAINVMKRRELEGDAGIERAFLETGGAVVACSMTTLSGYAALMLSVNGAVRSMGLAAAVGEAATQLSAMLVLPAVLYAAASLKTRRAKRAV
jgi:predicted RND superfamily exporter protein